MIFLKKYEDSQMNEVTGTKYVFESMSRFDQTEIFGDMFMKFKSF